MPKKLVLIENKWRDTKRQKKVIASVSATVEEVIQEVKRREPYIRADETFEFVSEQTLTDNEAKILSGQFGVITMPASEKIRSKKQTMKNLI